MISLEEKDLEVIMLNILKNKKIVKKRMKRKKKRRKRRVNWKEYQNKKVRMRNHKIKGMNYRLGV